MGYSYNVKAGLTLDAIRDILTEKHNLETSNGMPDGGFWETGREQSDGSITGTVWKPWEKDPKMVVKRGGFKISPEGKVLRFPGIGKAIKVEAEAISSNKYSEVYDKPLFQLI